MMNTSRVVFGPAKIGDFGGLRFWRLEMSLEGFTVLWLLHDYQ